MILLISALICDLHVLGGSGEILSTCWCCACSHWCLVWSSWVLTRTPSHIWESLYLPIFQFRIGLLILMYMDSLIALVKPCLSLPNMLKLFIVVRKPVVVWWSCIGEGAFKCYFYLSPNVLARFSNVFLITINPFTPTPIYYLHYMGSLSFGNTGMFFIVLLPLKYVLMPYPLNMPFVLSDRPCTYSMIRYPLYALLF